MVVWHRPATPEQIEATKGFKKDADAAHASSKAANARDRAMQHKANKEKNKKYLHEKGISNEERNARYAEVKAERDAKRQRIDDNMKKYEERRAAQREKDRAYMAPGAYEARMEERKRAALAGELGEAAKAKWEINERFDDVLYSTGAGGEELPKRDQGRLDAWQAAKDDWYAKYG